MDKIKPILPMGERLIEPFTGSGALFLNTKYPTYLLAEKNPDLLITYQKLQQHGESFIKECQPYFTSKYNQEEQYYLCRERFNRTRSKNVRARLFLYLNRNGYNGLCRYNQKGLFNVPFGRYIKPYFPKEEMTYFHQKTKSAEFLFADFEETLSHAQVGDVVYCDPPYLPLSKSASFTSYTSKNFNHQRQRKLATIAKALANRGIPVLISNHDTPEARRLYKDAEITTFEIQRHISCNGQKREKVKELLALYI